MYMYMKLMKKILNLHTIIVNYQTSTDIIFLLILIKTKE
jgi:hypothetical protein